MKIGLIVCVQDVSTLTINGQPGILFVKQDPFKGSQMTLKDVTGQDGKHKQPTAVT